MRPGNESSWLKISPQSQLDQENELRHLSKNVRARAR